VKKTILNIPDEIIKAGKIIAITLICAFVVAFVGVGVYHFYYPSAQTTTTVQAVTPTPAPTPTPYPAYWTNYQRINFLGTSAGFPQANFADGRGFNLPWNLYDSGLYLGDYVSFHVTGEYQPYSTTIFYVDDMRVSRYYDYGRYPRVVYGNAGRFCISENSKYSC